jgi:benzoyl-CoA reductase/2-hydroxyglutaryl-CoA dehydratase subunit BcrC/BadD/HgdB
MKNNFKNCIGFTTSIPVEIIFASHKKPLDINNIFITSKNPSKYIEIAENKGFPHNYCCWIKGLYGVIHKHKIKNIIGVVEGDCSDTHALLNILKLEKVNIIPFAYPYDKSYKILHDRIKKFMSIFNVTWDDVFAIHKKLQPIREMLYKLDYMSYNNFNISSKESHLWQVSASDFCSNYNLYKNELTKHFKTIKQESNVNYIRLGYIGVPPIVTDLYDYIDKHNAKIVFHEVQRQFTFPYLKDKTITKNNFKRIFIEQYLNYTYPYDISSRLKDIKNEIKKRNIAGVIHYVQSFCHRQADDMFFREQIDIPILTLEEDRPGKLSARSKVRLETFIKMCRTRR